jgi:hypothetical protein
MNKIKTLRKTHRYLGVIIGLQFLMWSISGLYFSWTSIDDIHGDSFKIKKEEKSFKNLKKLSELNFNEGVNAIELRDINGTPYYWINNKYLINAYNGIKKNGITTPEAIYVASNNVDNNLIIKKIELLKSVSKHHEYRAKKVPVYVITYANTDEVKAYVSKDDGKFQTLRHNRWRFFDFLWMTHTMDYQGRDNMNNLALRIFSIFGLITIVSGFALYFVSSPSVRKLQRKFK